MQGRGRGNVAEERLCGVLFVGLTPLKEYFYINLGGTLVPPNGVGLTHTVHQPQDQWRGSVGRESLSDSMTRVYASAGYAKGDRMNYRTVPGSLIFDSQSRAHGKVHSKNYGERQKAQNEDGQGPKPLFF